MIKRFLFWALFPLVIPQALIVKRTAPRFSGALGSHFGRSGLGDRCTLLAIGDSLVAGVGAGALKNALVGQTAKAIAARYNLMVEWSAHGEIGATTKRIRHKLLPGIPENQFDVIVISTGVNDVTGLTRTANFRRQLTALVEGLHEHSPDAQIVVAGLPPMHEFPLLPQPLRWLLGMRSRTFDQVVQEVTNKIDQAIYIAIDIEPDPKKFAGDGYHPSESGYADFGDAISAKLAPIRGQRDEYAGTNVAHIR